MKLTPFFTVLNQIKVLHWQTRSYAEHKALNKAYEALDGLFDTFVETYLGKYGRDEKKSEYIIKLHSYDFADSADLSAGLSAMFAKFLDIINGMIGEGDTDLKNLRDDIMIEFNHLKYLLTLK